MNNSVLNDLVNNNSATSNTLLHELQLGDKLNKCVYQSRRSDFALMLAMLCDDVREQSQFILPKSPKIDGTETDTTQLNNQQLRKYFDLPEETPLALKNFQQIDQYNQAKLIADNHLPSYHLSNAISPKPIAFRDDKKHISTNVLGNTSLVCQKKHEQNTKEKVLNKQLNMNVENWLKTVQTSIVKSTLVDVVAA